MKNTSNTQTTKNYNSAAGDIIELLDDLGFTSASQYDPEMLKQTIVQIIRQNIEPTDNYIEVECNPSCDMGGVNYPSRYDSTYDNR